MTDLHTRIASFASKNEELLAIIQETEHAEAAFKQQQIYVKDLDTNLSRLTANIRSLETKTRVRKYAYEQHRDSNTRRFVSKLGGSKGKEKFDSKTEKEERAYQEALQQEQAAKDHKASLDTALREGTEDCDVLQQDIDAHDQAKKDLDDLHNMLFAGPAPGFPQLEKAEWDCSQAREHFNTTEQKQHIVWQACETLYEATQHISRAAIHINTASIASQLDLFGGNTRADIAGAKALREAGSDVSKAATHVSQAKRVYPDGFQDIPRFRVVHDSVLSAVMFQTIIKDLPRRDMIMTSQTRILQAQASIQEQYGDLKRELVTHQQELDSAQAQLADARKRIQDARTKIFAEIGGQQPPPYQGHKIEGDVSAPSGSGNPVILEHSLST